MILSNIAKYLYEIGHMKRVKRSGWWLAGIKDPESIGEHSFRAAILGYVLASLEDADPLRTATICLFHDTGETRINDMHRVAQRYIKKGDSEEKALLEQTERLPENIAKDIQSLFREYEERISLEAKIARDADLLECIFQAREYQSQGFPDVQDWITNCFAGLQTETARNLAEACLHTDPKEWWEGLKRK